MDSWINGLVDLWIHGLWVCEFGLSPLSLNIDKCITLQVLSFPVHGVQNAVDTVESKESDLWIRGVVIRRFVDGQVCGPVVSWMLEFVNA